MYFFFFYLTVFEIHTLHEVYNWRIKSIIYRVTIFLKVERVIITSLILMELMTINVCKKLKIPENTMAKRKNRTKRTKNDPQNTRKRTNDRAMRTPLKQDEIWKCKQLLVHMCHPSCYSFHMHEWGKGRIMTTTNKHKISFYSDSVCPDLQNKRYRFIGNVIMYLTSPWRMIWSIRVSSLMLTI